MAEHTLSAAPTHSRWNAALPPRLTIGSGDVVHFECQDSSGAQVYRGMTVEEFQRIDRGLIHALTGPVAIQGAEPGDVLQVDVLEVRHKGWGWSSVIPGLGFLKQRFTEPFLFHWELEPLVSRSLAPATVPLRPFCGIMGVASAEQGEFRTRPPGAFGGNMDVRELAAGATLYLPVLQPGALFSCGDVHAAQGDGGGVHQWHRVPRGCFFAVSLVQAAIVGSAIDRIVVCAGRAWAGVGGCRVIDGRACGGARRHRSDGRPAVESVGIDPVHAYLLCSVAMHLRLSQVVNEPMITVSASIAKSILPERVLFSATNGG